MPCIDNYDDLVSKMDETDDATVVAADDETVTIRWLNERSGRTFQCTITQEAAKILFGPAPDEASFPLH